MLVSDEPGMHRWWNATFEDPEPPEEPEAPDSLDMTGEAEQMAEIGVQRREIFRGLTEVGFHA